MRHWSDIVSTGSERQWRSFKTDRNEVKSTADFDFAMDQVAAVSGATGSDLDALREKACEMRSKTKFSASEAAEVINYMAMVGWKTEDMLSGMVVGLWQSASDFFGSIWTGMIVYHGSNMIVDQPRLVH